METASRGGISFIAVPLIAIVSATFLFQPIVSAADASRVAIRGQVVNAQTQEPIEGAQVVIALKGGTIDGDPIVTPDFQHEERQEITDGLGVFRTSVAVPRAALADPTVTSITVLITVAKTGNVLFSEQRIEQVIKQGTTFSLRPILVHIPLKPAEGLPAVIRGVVRDADTREPLSGIHLYQVLPPAGPPDGPSFILLNTESHADGTYLATVAVRQPSESVELSFLAYTDSPSSNGGHINGMIYLDKRITRRFAPGRSYTLDVELQKDKTKPVVFGRLLDGVSGKPIPNAQARFYENDYPAHRHQVWVVGTDFLGRYQFAISEPSYVVDLHSNGAYTCLDDPSEPYYCEHVNLGGRLMPGELFEQNIVLSTPRAKPQSQ